MAARSLSGSTAAGRGRVGVGLRRLGRLDEEFDAQLPRQRFDATAKTGRDEQPLDAGRDGDALEGRIAAIDRVRDGAEPRPNGPQIGGDEERAVFGEQSDPFAGRLGSSAEDRVPAADGTAKRAMGQLAGAENDGPIVAAAARQQRFGDVPATARVETLQGPSRDGSHTLTRFLLIGKSAGRSALVLHIRPFPMPVRQVGQEDVRHRHERCPSD